MRICGWFERFLKFLCGNFTYEVKEESCSVEANGRNGTVCGNSLIATASQFGICNALLSCLKTKQSTVCSPLELVINRHITVILSIVQA